MSSANLTWHTVTCVHIKNSYLTLSMWHCHETHTLSHCTVWHCSSGWSWHCGTSISRQTSTGTLSHVCTLHSDTYVTCTVWHCSSRWSWHCGTSISRHTSSGTLSHGCKVNLILPAQCVTALQDDRGTVSPQYHGTPLPAHCHMCIKLLLSYLHSVALLFRMIVTLWHLNITAHLLRHTVTLLLLVCILRIIKELTEK
jgi:hypothetical protein